MAMLFWPLRATKDAGIPKKNNNAIPADDLLEMSKLQGLLAVPSLVLKLSSGSAQELHVFGLYTGCAVI